MFKHLLQGEIFSKMLLISSINYGYSGIFCIFLQISSVKNTKQFDKISYRKVNFTIFFLLFRILYLICSQNIGKKYKNAVRSVVSKISQKNVLPAFQFYFYCIRYF